jgi:hypothetical protein
MRALGHERFALVGQAGPRPRLRERWQILATTLAST